MPGHHAVVINNQHQARMALERIGVDPEGYPYLLPKALFRTILLKNLPCRAANIIKQEMLSKGGEAAVSREALSLEGQTDVLLMGTLKQYRLLVRKLRVQPFKLKETAAEIEAILQGLEQSGEALFLANGRELPLGQRTLVMGILNVTPDSFSDGGQYLQTDLAVKRALEMAAQGADIIDVGGASARPGGAIAGPEEELKRILPVIEQLSQAGLIISVDTFRGYVARACLEAGAHLINDIGRLKLDKELLPVLVEHQAPVVLMHNRMQMRRGEPYQDLVSDIITELQESIEEAVNAGLPEERIIIDPGIGFGKTVEENLCLIKRLKEFRSLGKPVLLGASRKTFIGKALDLEVGERLEGSLAVVAMGVMNGTDMVRVHDVKESKRVTTLCDAVVRSDG